MKIDAVPLALALSLLAAVVVLGVSPESPREGVPRPSSLDAVLGARTAPGAFVIDLDAGSPAEQAGLRLCDLIGGFNGQGFREYGELGTFVDAMREAAKLSAALEVWKRSDSSQTYRQDRLTVRIPPRPESRLGVSFTFQVLVVEVVEKGPADVAGVRAGEFIDQVNGKKISEARSIMDLDRRISEIANRDESVLLTLARWTPLNGPVFNKTHYVTRDVTLRFDHRDVR